MSKLSLKVLLGLFALIFSASIGLGATPVCSGSPKNIGLFGNFGFVEDWDNCIGEQFWKRRKRENGHIPNDRVGERYYSYAKGLWIDGKIANGTVVNAEGTYEGKWEYLNGLRLNDIFTGKVKYLDGSTFNGQIGKLSKTQKGNPTVDRFAYIGTLIRPDGTKRTGIFKRPYKENPVYTFDQWQLVSSSIAKLGTSDSLSNSSSKLTLLKAEFIKLSGEDRRFIQSRLADLKLYSSSIDSLYGKGTESALNAYNKRYLGDADLGKSANADALLKDILTPEVLEVEQVARIEKLDLSLWHSTNLCIWAKEITPNDGTIWATNPKYKEYVAEAQRRGLTCGVEEMAVSTRSDKFVRRLQNSYITSDKEVCMFASTYGKWETTPRLQPYVAEAQRRSLSCGVAVKDIPKQAAAIEQPEPEPTPKLDIAQVKASYDAKDYTKAFADAQVLAVQGDPEAQLLLGKMFADGRGTLQVSIVAHMWFNIASMGGIDGAYEERKTITAQMTPSAVEEAQKMAMKCIQSTYADCGLAVKPVAVKQPKPVQKTYITSGPQVEAWFKDETLLKRKQLHYALKKLRLYTSSVDGLWGGNTSRAFTRYINKYKRDAENVDEIFASIFSKVKVPSTFSTPKKSYSSSSSSGNNSSSRSTSSNNAGLIAIISNPSMSGKQALAICEPQAKLAGRSAADSYDSPSSGSRTRCTSFTGYSINCRTTSNSGGGGIAGGILEGLAAGLKGRRVAETVLESCLAQYGWKK